MFIFHFISDMDMGALKAQVRNLSLPVNIAWIGPHLRSFVEERIFKKLPVLFFSSDPNILTAGKLFTRVKFPLCQDDLTKVPMDCDFGLNQFTKVVWSRLKTSIPEAYHVVSKLTFHQDEYTSLLQMFRQYSHVDKIACEWVKSNEDIWKKWLPNNLSNKTRIYLGGLFPLTGFYWMEPGLVQGMVHYFEVKFRDQSSFFALYLFSFGLYMQLLKLFWELDDRPFLFQEKQFIATNNAMF